MPSFVKDLIYSLIYIALVALAYVLQLDSMLWILTLPWSWVLTILGFLIVLMTVGGEGVIQIGMIVGSLLNSLLFLIFRRLNRLGV